MTRLVSCPCRGRKSRIQWNTIEVDAAVARSWKQPIQNSNRTKASTRKSHGEEPLIAGFVTVEHRVPMLSIDNVYNETELAEFGQRVCKLLEGRPCEWLVEYKVDGVALSLIYEQGRLVRGCHAAATDVVATTSLTTLEP